MAVQSDPTDAAATRVMYGSIEGAFNDRCQEQFKVRTNGAGFQLMAPSMPMANG